MTNMDKLQEEVHAELARQSKEVQSEPKEIIMNTTHKAVDAVKNKVNGAINKGSEFARDPRSIGRYIAEDVNHTEDVVKGAVKGAINKIGSAKNTVHDVTVLSFALIKEGLKEIKAGYKEARRK